MRMDNIRVTLKQLPTKNIALAFNHGCKRTIKDSNSVVYVVELQNTGNIPMVSAKILIDNYQVSLSLEKWLQPKDKITLDTSISLPFQKGTSWNIELEATYAEGSTFSATNIFTFQ